MLKPTARILTSLLLLLTAWPAAAEAPWPPKNFSCYYGEVDGQKAKELGRFELLVVHPGKHMDNLTPAKVANLRAQGVEKTVIGYISVGESEASPGGPPLQGNEQTGPTFVGASLAAALANNGYPARFVDQRAFTFGADGFLTFGPDGKPAQTKGQDGHPDENGVWGSYYVKADDPGWEAHIFKRLKELDELGLDGFFLDTVDTASPWGDYGWTSSGMLNLVEKIRKAYPDKRIVANRGLFYVGSNDRYAKLIDAVLFESLLTLYREATETAEISPWARWHVQALDNDVVPTQKRTKMHLLVLDYLNPEQENVAVLVQAMRTLLEGSPYSLSFSHPALQIPGWTAEDILKGSSLSLPALKEFKFKELDQPGEFTLSMVYAGPIPKGAIPDLRVTDRDDLKPARAAQLPLAEILSSKVEGNTLTVRGGSLDQASKYRMFFRLLTDSQSKAPEFGWTTVETKDSELPAQVTDVSSKSDSTGLVLKFKDKVEDAVSYRVYRRRGKTRVKVVETKTSPAKVTGVKVKEAAELLVVPVNGEGKEGYPSAIHVAVRGDVTPPPVPGKPSVADGEVSWRPVPGAKSYRLYVVPQGAKFRLPIITEEPTATLKGVKPGAYSVFVTSVDGSGNQSAPGPRVSWAAK